MLKSAEIIQYRSCLNVKVAEIANLQVLLGKNGAGKSNVMKAIEWAAKNACSLSINEADKCFRTNNGEVRLNFEVNKKEYSYYLKRSDGLLADTQEAYIEILERVGLDELVASTIFSRDGQSLNVPIHAKEYDVSKEIPAISAICLLLPVEDQLKQTLLQISEFLESFKFFSLDQHPSSANFVLTKEDEYLKWVGSKDNKTAYSVSKIPIYKIIDLFLNNKEKFEELLSLLGDDGLGIINLIRVREVDLSFLDKTAEDTKKPDNYYIVHFRPIGHESIFSFEDLSFGTKRIIEFILSLVYDTYSVALVEQIEDGIHEGLIYKLIELIRSYSDDGQFILTSHSSAVFNCLSPEEVRLVELNEGATEVKQLTTEQIEAAKQFMAEEGSFSEVIGVL